MKWISVKDKLPPVSTEVIAYCPNSRSKVKALSRYWLYDDKGGYFWGNSSDGGNIHSVNDVTYWMSMPKFRKPR